MSIKKVIVIDANIKAAEKKLAEVNEQLQIQDNVINTLTKDVAAYEKELKRVGDTNSEQNQKLTKQLKEKKAALTGEKKALTDLNKKRGEATKALGKARAEAVDFGGSMQALDSQTGGAVSGLMALKGGVLNLGKSFRTLDGILKLSLLGIIVTSILSLVAAFKSSEEGQERFTKLWKQAGVVIRNITDILSDIGTSILNVGKAMVKLAQGDLAGMAVAFNDAKTNINDAAGAIKNFGEETKKEMKIAGQIADQRAKAHHLERDLLVERAKANRDINDIRLEAEKRDQYTAEQRVALLKKAQKIEEDITNKEIKAKQLVIDAQEKEMSLGKNTIEDKDKLAKLQAELIKLDTKKLRSQRLLQTQITTAQNQEKAAKEAKKKEEQKELDDMVMKAWDTEKQRRDGIKAIQDAYKESEKEEAAVTEAEKLQLDKDKAIAELDRLNATKEQRANIIAYWDGKITEAESKETEKRKVLQEKVEAAKVQSAMRGMALIQEIAGKGSAVGKAMAVGQATISGIEGVQNAFTTASKSPITTFFPAYPFVQAGLAGAFSALQIKQILSTDASGKSISGGAPTVGGGGTPAPTPSAPPAFNVVGASGSNQLAGAIASQAQTPIKTYVVANDVTTGQALERNTIEGASIG